MGSAQCRKNFDKSDTDYMQLSQRTRVDSYDEVENRPCFGCGKTLKQNVDFCSDCTGSEKFKKKMVSMNEKSYLKKIIFLRKP